MPSSDELIYGIATARRIVGRYSYVDFQVNLIFRLGARIRGNGSRGKIDVALHKPRRRGSRRQIHSI